MVLLTIQSISKKYLFDLFDNNAICNLSREKRKCTAKCSRANIRKRTNTKKLKNCTAVDLHLF